MRKWLLIPVVVLVLAVGFPRPAGATAPTEYIATYTVSTTDTSVRQAGGNTIVEQSGSAVLTGDIVGSATQTDRLVVHADDSVNLQGRFTCTCTVAGRSGTVTVRFTGTAPAGGVIEGHDVVVSGTGGLASLHGQGTFHGTATPGVVAKDLFLHFDPS